MIPQYAALLTPEQVAGVHEASLEVLERVGLRVHNAEARAIFVRRGARLEAETGIVRLPRAVVEEFRRLMPPRFVFRGRDAGYDRAVPDDGPLVVTASSAPDVIDPSSGVARRARSDDIARMARLIHELPGYDIFGVATIADDAPAEQVGLWRIYPALVHCLKPVRCSAPSLEEWPRILDLCATMAGGEPAFWERPFLTFMYCAVVSPLVMDVESTAKLMRFAEMGMPAYPVVAPNAGVTAPMTLLGMLVVCNAEFLAQAVLAQMVRPGTPLLYDSLPAVSDMRTGAYAPGAIETGMALMACAQMARYYGVPSAGYVGLTNAKRADAQAGFETGMSALAAALAGLDVLALGGLVDALMAFDFAKATMDSEIALMVKRVVRGLHYDQEHLAGDVIADVGPGGMFADHPHTRRHMRAEVLLPEIAERGTRAEWEAAGRPDAATRALEKARRLLAGDLPAFLSPEVEARLRVRFAEVVAGLMPAEDMER